MRHDEYFIQRIGKQQQRQGVVEACLSCSNVGGVGNVRIFEDKARSSKGLWDMIFFITSFQASCSTTFKGVPLNLIQLDWMLVCNSKGVGQQGQIIFVCSQMGLRLWNIIVVQILKLGDSCFLFVYFLEDLSSFFVLILLTSIYYIVVSHKKIKAYINKIGANLSQCNQVHIHWVLFKSKGIQVLFH